MVHAYSLGARHNLSASGADPRIKPQEPPKVLWGFFFIFFLDNSGPDNLSCPMSHEDNPVAQTGELSRGEPLVPIQPSAPGCKQDGGFNASNKALVSRFP
jgi:hypothetical protein